MLIIVETIIKSKLNQRIAFGSLAVIVLVNSVGNCFAIFNTPCVDVCFKSSFFLTQPHPQPEMNLKHTLKLFQKPIISFHLLHHVYCDYCDQTVQRKHCLLGKLMFCERS